MSTADEGGNVQSPATNDQAFSFADALVQLRAHARADPGVWKAAENSRQGLKLEWRSDPEDADSPERLRISRRLVHPVSEDLEFASKALPRDVEIGPILPDRAARSLLLGLRPRTQRAAGTRCPTCGGQPRLGTRLYGDAQRCAVCSVFAPPPPPEAEPGGGTRGSVLIGTVILTLMLAMIVGGAMMTLEAAEKARGARTQTHLLDAAATTAIETMTARLRARAQLRLGNIDELDVTWLNGQNGSLVAPGAALVGAETGYRIVGIREQDPIPEDAELLDVWTDQPRIRYSSLPRPQGQMASRTIEVEMRARVTGTGSQRTLTRTVAISRLMPHPYALYVSGSSAEFCQPGGLYVSGAVRADAHASFQAGCGGLTILGTLEARDGVTNAAPAANRFLSTAGFLPLPSVSRAAASTSPGSVLGVTAGHQRIPSAWGGSYEASRRQDAATAGTGECADRAAACAGNGYFAPGLTVQRTTIGNTPAITVTCGPAYLGTGTCGADAAAAGYYVPWPWSAAHPPNIAVADVPPVPGRHWWRGLLFDPRREGRCTATVPPYPAYQTHRCPSNTFGYVLNLSLLPPIPGGVIHVAAASADPPGRFAAGAQEALVIRSAELLQGPLTIVSDLPVFIVGSLNTVRQAAWRGPPPLMIDAPRITLLPAEADEHLGLQPGTTGWASVWDLATPVGSTTPSALPLTASANVTLYAVLRTRMCVGGTGDAPSHAPAAIGNWSGAEIRVVGAVELTEDVGLTPAQCRWLGIGAGATADGSVWMPAARRTILHDPRLNHPSFRVPGSYLRANIPSGGVPGAANRTPDRQERASGGYGVARIVQETGRRKARAAVGLKPLPPLPPAPPALPL